MKFSGLCISLLLLLAPDNNANNLSDAFTTSPGSTTTSHYYCHKKATNNPFHTATIAAASSSSRTATNSRRRSTTRTAARTTRTAASHLHASPNVVEVAGDIVNAPLSQYFLRACIDNGIPALFTILTVAVAAFFIKKSREGGGNANDFFENKNAIDELYSDLYGSTASGKIGGNAGPFGGGFGGGLPGGGGGGGLNKEQKRNLGIPSTQYIQVKNLNEKYASYDFSLKMATSSKASAAADFRSQAFDRALQKALTPSFGSSSSSDDEATTTSSSSSSSPNIPSYAKAALLSAEKNFLTKGRTLVGEIQELEGQLVKASLDVEIIKMGMDKPYDPKPAAAASAAVIQEGDDDEKSIAGVIAGGVIGGGDNNGDNAADKKKKVEKAKKMQQQNKKITEKVTKELSKLQGELQDLELEFIQQAVAAVGPERALGFRAALLRDVQARGIGGLLKQLERRPLSAFFLQSDHHADAAAKSLFVMKFPGDVTASQLNELREEVTAIIRNAKPGDEALLVLQSGGGTVTGYGLAAGQLVRLKEKGIFLTIAVEQVAASGGYMMTCVADKIIASPFAVLGSIGVISEQPNVYERLKREGIEFQTVTAGEFKRTLTPTKKVTKEDFNKAKEDVSMILEQFSGFVAKNRPSLDIKSVATGETWFGDAALEKGLCDEIRPVDDVLLRYVDEGYQVYEIAYKAPTPIPSGLASLLPFSSSNLEGGSSNNDNNNYNSLGKRMVRWLVSSVMEEFRDNYLYERGTGTRMDQAQQRYMAQDDTADRMKMEERL